MPYISIENPEYDDFDWDVCDACEALHERMGEWLEVFGLPQTTIAGWTAVGEDGKTFMIFTKGWSGGPFWVGTDPEQGMQSFLGMLQTLV